MRIQAIVVILVTSLRLAAVEIPYHPLRSVGGTNYNLVPLYQYANARKTYGMQELMGIGDLRYGTQGGPQKTAKLKLPVRPLTNWVVYPIDAVSWGTSAMVLQVLDDGLLLEVKEFFCLPTRRERPPAICFLQNYPNKAGLKDGAAVAFIAIQAGTYSYTDLLGARRTVARYDYGIPVAAPPARQTTVEESASVQQRQAETRAKMAASLLRSDQESAARGNEYAQYRLGMLYMTGDGVPTNQATAREWLLKAAEQGHPEASNELRKLPAK